MKPTMRDRIKGELHEIKGKAKGESGSHEQPTHGSRRPKRKTCWQNPKESRPDQSVRKFAKLRPTKRAVAPNYHRRRRQL